MRSGQPAVWRIDTYRDTREAQVIAELSGSETVQCIAEEIVGPLRAHDAASGMDLLDTPVTFIKCNCNISLTARTLYIHRTSLPIGWKRVNRSQECRSKTGYLHADVHEILKWMGRGRSELLQEVALTKV